MLGKKKQRKIAKKMMKSEMKNARRAERIAASQTTPYTKRRWQEICSDSAMNAGRIQAHLKDM